MFIGLLILITHYVIVNPIVKISALPKNYQDC
jgi:hypothetical protein